jgi:hypothetical protein
MKYGNWFSAKVAAESVEEEEYDPDREDRRLERSCLSCVIGSRDDRVAEERATPNPNPEAGGD